MEYAVVSIRHIVQSELLTEDDLLLVSSLCEHYMVGRVTVCTHVYIWYSVCMYVPTCIRCVCVHVRACLCLCT